MRRLPIVVALMVSVPSLVACGGGNDARGQSSSGAGSVTLYNAQHQDLMEEMTAAFTEQTGIKVEMRNGDDLEMANQIVQEGTASPADVFATENSPAMSLVGSRGLFAPIQGAALEQVPARYRPSDDAWVGFAARETVFVHNTGKLAGAELPASLLDLADPEWKGRFGYSPTGADFQAIVSAVLELEGPSVTKTWLAGLKRNGRAYEGNTKVMAAVNDGQVDGGVIYHYYWYKDQAESGADSANTKLHFFRNEDPGAFTSVSGVGVLKAGENQANARRLVEFLTSKAGQQVLAESTALEYPIASGVAADEALEPLASFEAPTVDPSKLNSKDVTKLMQDAGIL
jgi:iron(III) transport system substrate-binding protein